jgi:type IV pilus assembly protein PilP
MMKKYRFRQVIYIGLLATMVVSCSSRGLYTDLDEFIAEVAGKPKGQIAPLPEFQAYKPFTYSSSNRRSPFEPPIIIPKKTEEQVKNTGVKPPENHVKEYLERFNIASLTMVGTLEQNEEAWALIEDSQGGVHRIQVGDYLGTNWGIVEAITPNRVDVVEIVSDGTEGWLRRPRSLELKSDGR